MAILTQQITINNPLYLGLLAKAKLINFNVIDDTDFNPSSQKEVYLKYRTFFYNSENEWVMKAETSNIVSVHLTNNQRVLQRDFANNFQPIPNPDYADILARTQLSEDDENYLPIEALNGVEEFLKAPAYDYFFNLKQEHPEYLWVILIGYTLENCADGIFEPK